jgi:hypothetical protein
VEIIIKLTMSDVDRKRLLNALELRRKDVCEKFSWGFQLCFPGPSLTIKSFYVNEIGADVSVPVSYQVANRYNFTHFQLPYICFLFTEIRTSKL